MTAAAFEVVKAAKYPTRVTDDTPSLALTDTLTLLYAVDAVDIDEHHAM